MPDDARTAAIAKDSLGPIFGNNRQIVAPSAIDGYVAEVVPRVGATSMRVLRFRVRNFRSLHHECELSFVSTSQPDEQSARIPSEHTPHGVLPVVGLWGANASGKSNVLRAMLAFRDVIADSFHLAPDQPIPREPFQGTPDQTVQTTSYALDFELDGVLHEYGFDHCDERFRNEWLFIWPAGRRQRVFERRETDATPWSFGASFRGARKALIERTRPNALFLSTAAQLNHDELTRVHRALSRGIRGSSMIALQGYPIFRTNAPIVDSSRTPEVEALLRAIDLGCVGVDVEEVTQDLPSEVVELLRPEVVTQMRSAPRPSARRVRLIRRTSEGVTWTLPPHMESTGTNVMLQRINDLLSHTSGLLIIDELDNSLHPDLVRALLSVFTREDVNRAGRQLLFSAHDRTLLDELRRDQIVMADKNAEGETTLTSLSDFRGIRRERVRLADLHAHGSVGGTPILSDLAALVRFEDPHEQA